MLLLARALFLVLSGLPRGFRPLFSLFAGNRFRRGTRAFLARALRAIIRARHGGGALPNTILPNNISHGSRQQKDEHRKRCFQHKLPSRLFAQSSSRLHAQGTTLVHSTFYSEAPFELLLPHRHDPKPLLGRPSHAVRHRQATLGTHSMQREKQLRMCNQSWQQRLQHTQKHTIYATNIREAGVLRALSGTVRLKESGTGIAGPT